MARSLFSAMPKTTMWIIGIATTLYFYLLFSAVTAIAADSTRGADLFVSWSCADCHTLADAGAIGTIGPSLDGNSNLSFDYIVSSISNGGGAMPPFGGQLTEDEIADIAAYILEAAQ